jgi:hypothetical protein
MKTNIHIDAEPFAETKYYSGIYSFPDHNHPESEFTEYTFTISTQFDENVNDIFIIEITWTDNKPSDSELAEEQIRKFWKSS